MRLRFLIPHAQTSPQMIYRVLVGKPGSSDGLDLYILVAICCARSLETGHPGVVEVFPLQTEDV